MGTPVVCYCSEQGPILLIVLGCGRLFFSALCLPVLCLEWHYGLLNGNREAGGRLKAETSDHEEARSGAENHNQLLSSSPPVRYSIATPHPAE